MTHHISFHPRTSPVCESSGLTPVLRNVPPQGCKNWLAHQPIVSPGIGQESCRNTWGPIKPSGLDWTPLLLSTQTWTPLDSTAVLNTKVDSTGLHWTVSYFEHKTGLDWTGLDSTAILNTKLDSTGLDWTPLLYSTQNWTPLDCQLHLTL